MSMKDVRVRTVDLREAIQKNREIHRSTFLKAQEGFRKRVVEELDRRLADARAGIKYDIYIGLPQPEDKTKEYDCVIRMLTMTVEQEILISHQEFSQYVLDDWAWKAGWSTTNSTYGA